MKRLGMKRTAIASSLLLTFAVIASPVLRQYHICLKIIDFSPRELRYSSACSRSHLPYSVFFSRHVMSGKSPWRTLPFVSSWR